MNIKTVTTTDGVNTVDFGSAASRFYWFRNIGTTTVYVSGNSDILAGGDGVAELPSGGSVCIETLGGKVYVLGAGKVQIHNTGDKFCPFRNAPVSSGGGAADITKMSYNDVAFGFLKNAYIKSSSSGGCGYNLASDIDTDRFCIYRNASNYNITYSSAMDFTDIKKIRISGATKSNHDSLSTTAYYAILDAGTTAIDSAWPVLNQSVGTDISEFTAEIDCSGITGEKYLHIAVLHGTEIGAINTSYLYIDSIEIVR